MKNKKFSNGALVLLLGAVVVALAVLSLPHKRSTSTISENLKAASVRAAAPLGDGSSTVNGANQVAGNPARPVSSVPLQTNVSPVSTANTSAPEAASVPASGNIRSMVLPAPTASAGSSGPAGSSSSTSVAGITGGTAQSFSIYRTPAEILAGKDLSDPVQREIAASEMADAEEARYAAVLAKAQEMGIPVRVEGPGRGVKILYDIRDEGPLYRKTLNANAAISSGANLLAPAPYSLNGASIKVGVWDAGAVRNTHREFSTTRVIKRNNVAVDDHATHVAGTVGASGVTVGAKGMAPAIAIDSWDWTSDYSEMTSSGASTAIGETNKIPLSNHSYGYSATTSDMGRYNSASVQTDSLSVSMPYYLICWAAGNEQTDLPAKGGYQSITYNGLSKNVLTVGAVNDAVTSGSRDVSKASMSSFSSWGPCDDGRIKPDVVANGVTLNSPISTGDSAYGIYSGTSMATPSAMGSAALLVQLYAREFGGQRMRSSMLRGLLIHTADDLGNAGPDYKFGWGLINVKRAADLILAHKASGAAPKMIENSLTSSIASRTHTFQWDGVSPIRVTLCWTDPAGTAQADNSRTPNLRHNLDLSVTAPSAAVLRPYIMPFVGDWSDEAMSAVATTGKNNVDNVEQVYVSSPQVGTYTVTVSRDGSLSTTSQSYALLISGGASAETNPPPVVSITAPADGIAVLPSSTVLITAGATDMAVGGQPGEVAKVEFYEGETLLGQVTAEPYQFSWTPASSGARVITAKATDNENATTVSPPVTVNVLVGNGAPSIVGFSPAGGVAGEAVVVTGNNLGVATGVRFGALTSTFVVNSPSQLTATVPTNAVSAPIVVSNSYGTTTSITNFNILPILFREDFSSITGGDSEGPNGSNTAWTGNSNFPSNSLVRVYQAGGAVKLGASSGPGSMTSRAINLSGNGGAFNVSLKVKGWSTVEGQIKVTAGAQSQTVTYAATMTGEFETKTLNFTGGTATTTIKIETTAKRAFIDDVVITSEAPTSPPVITSPVTAGGIAGTAFSYQIAASNSPTSFGASNLPAWASINTTSGVISGANPTAGTNTVSISASNSVGVGSTNLTITIIPSGGGGGGVTNTIFSENMGTPTGNTAISNYVDGTAPATFQNKGLLTFGQGDQANPADVRVTTVSTNAGASGGGNIWFTTAAGSYGFSIEGINASNYEQLQLTYGYYKNSATAHATFSIDYWNGSAWVTVTNTTSGLFNEAANAASAWYLAKTLTLPAGAQINGLKLRFVKTGTNAIRIDDIKLTGVTSSSSPSITTSGSLSAVNTTYGAASATPTSFSVSGSNLATGITVAPPNGFEVSAGNTNSFAGGGTSIIVGSAGTVSSTPVYLRLAADADVGTYSGNIVCSSVGASSANVATVASTVSPKGISVTADLLRKTYGAEDPELTYSSSESAPFSGELARAAGENVGVYAIGQGDLTAGPNYAIAFTGNNFEITRKNISVTANDITKTFGESLSLGPGQAGFSASGLANGETIGSVTLASEGAAAGAVPGTYALVPSAATGGTFTASNYSIIYNTGTLTVSGTAAPSFDDYMNNYPGLTGNDRLPAADPDKDGVANLMEYYMGRSADTYEGSGIILSNNLTASPSTISVIYQRAKNIAGVTGNVRWSSVLTNANSWSTNGVSESVRDLGTVDEITATVTNAPGETVKFLRLRVTQP